ncbi:MAG: tetratricopeptide repeat protein, partial [Planctomycetota bacterium]|nr:tetratricopeptide repeat protein [Planctomycetota bacterium]
TEMKARSRPELQLEFARLAVDVNSEDPQVHNHLAEALRDSGDSSEAITVYRETVARFPQNVVCRCGLAESLREVGEPSEAITVYRETVARFPQDVVCRCGLAETLREVGDSSEAITVYRETVARFPQDEVCRCGLAETLREVGEPSEAITVYRETVARFPQDEVCRNGLAETLREVGESSEAILVYRETVARFPQDAVSRCGLAETLREVGEPSEAISVYRETVARFPQNEVCRNGLAEALREVGESSEAIRVYRETVTRFPQDEVCRCGLAVMLAEDSKFDEALELLPVESPKTHQELIGWHIRGMVYLQKKDTAAAVATFKIGLERSRKERDRTYYRNSLASAYLRTGQHREAVDLLEGASDELSDLFRAHALGELEDRDLVKQALDRLRGTTKPEVQELRNEFEEVYVRDDPQSKRLSTDWLDRVFQREFELLRDATRSMHRQSAV